MRHILLPLLMAGLLGSSAHVALAQAGPSGAVQILKFKADAVDVFDTTGRFLSQKPSKEFGPFPLSVTTRNETLGLIEVKAGGASYWIDEDSAELNVPLKTSNVVCRDNPKAKPKDSQAAVALGMNKCSK